MVPQGNGDAWDDLLDGMAKRGRLLEFPCPALAGVVINPIGCDDKVKIALDGTQTVKS